ncbi:MAG: acetolactate synthase small subunit [Candidatus Hadarchaeales archaeon]
MKKRIFSVLCQNIPGVMMRVSREFTRRQINLDSVTVGIEPTGLARMILIFNADDMMADFMRRVLLRAEPVVDVEVIDPAKSIVREVALLRTKPLEDSQLWSVVTEIERAGGKVIDSKGGMLIAELSGDHEDIERIVKKLGPEILKEVARSGQVLISREERCKR